MEESELKLIKHASFDWLKQNIQFIQAGEDIEVATPLIGAYGDLVYCWIEKERDGAYRITDDGGTLFKLDPAQENVDLGNMAQTLSDLTQLQVALTYLAS